MAHHSIIIRPKHGVFDRDVFEKAMDELLFLREHHYFLK